MIDIVQSLKAVDHRSIEDCFLQSPLFDKAADEIILLRQALSEAERREKGVRRKALEEAATLAECAFDDRGNSRSGHHSEMDWSDGYRDATHAAAAAIRALKDEVR